MFFFQSSFHPAFRGEHQNAMEIDQITSLVSIFSFGQHVLQGGQKDAATASPSDKPDDEKSEESDKLNESDKKSEDDSDSESDTSSDSGHSSDDHETSKEEETSPTTSSSSSPTTTNVLTTKLKRSVSTPDLCSVSVVSNASGINSSDSPLCVEVASV